MSNLKFDLQERFIIWLMDGFYKSLQDDLNRLSERLVGYMRENKEQDIEMTLKMINETRGIMNDLSDENMDPKDFVHLILGKYHEEVPNIE